MRRRLKVTVLLLSVMALLTATNLSASARTIQNRKKKRIPSSRVTTPKKAAPPASENVARNYDIGIEVVPTRFGRVLVITHREEVPITIRNITINNERSYRDNENLLHSTHSWISLPAELKLGDTLRVPIHPYKKAVIYVGLDTNKGELTFKLGK